MLFSATAAWADGDGDGSLTHPYSGEWLAYDLGKKIKVGDYLAYNCVVRWGDIDVFDDKLDNAHIVPRHQEWAVGDVIDESPFTGYSNYCDLNSFADRQRHMFVVTAVNDINTTMIDITGHYTGLYDYTPDEDGFFRVYTAPVMRSVLGHDGSSKVLLMDDVYLSDVPDATMASTFTGTLDGGGHTIWAARPEVQHDGGGHYKRSYLFTSAERATVKNLTFKNIREHSSDRGRQAIIVQQATNRCHFDNITFDNVSIWSAKDEAGAVAGYSQSCTFTNITVKNSDFTVDGSTVGVVTGCSDEGTLLNIVVENCDCTAYGSQAGGVAGRCITSKFSAIKVKGLTCEADDDNAGGVVGEAFIQYISNQSIFTDIDIQDCFITVNGVGAGGVAGRSEYGYYADCTIDDQTGICADGGGLHAYAGGVVGYSRTDNFHNCINSALIAADDNGAGGIAGYADDHPTISFCLNTGMVVSIPKSKVIGSNGYYSKYKNQELPCIEKYYRGKRYVIRLTGTDIGKTSHNYYGGIVGSTYGASIKKCANLGSMNLTDATGGIAGEAYFESSITDCFTDFIAPAGVYGIVKSNMSFIMNCLDLSEKPSYDTQYSTTNLYNKDNIIEAQLLSGEICASLGAAWEQNLGTDPYPTPTGDKGLYHTRQMIGKDYGTICVPFPLKSLNGVGISRREYYTFKEVKNEADGTMSLCFEYVDEVPAGTPAIFSAYVTGPYEFVQTKAEYEFEPQSTDGTEWSFCGTYEQKTFTGDEAKCIYYLDGTADKCAIRNATKTTIAPYRAYFTGPSIETFNGSNGSPARAVRFILADEDGETTTLQLVGDDLVPVQNGKTYTLFGTEAGKGYRGIVVRNGKLVRNY